MLNHWQQDNVLASPECQGTSHNIFKNAPPSLPAFSLGTLSQQPFDLVSNVKSCYSQFKPQSHYQETKTPVLSTHESFTSSSIANFNSNSSTTSSPPTSYQDDLWSQVPSLPHSKKHRSWDDGEDIYDTTLYLTDSVIATSTVYDEHCPHTWIIRRSRLIKDIHSLLLGLPSMCFRWNQDQQRFEQRKPGLRLTQVTATSLTNFLNPMMEFGSQLLRTIHFADRTRQQSMTHSCLSVSFGCSLLDLLVYLQHTIDSFFRATSAPLSLIAIDRHMKPFYALMTSVQEFCGTQNLPAGASLLTKLYNQVLAIDDLRFQPQNEFSRALWMTLLVTTAVPWFDMLESWLNTGEFNDRYQDFFLDEQREVQTQRLPCFLDLPTARLILRAGRTDGSSPPPQLISLSSIPKPLTTSLLPRKEMPADDLLSLNPLADPELHFRQQQFIRALDLYKTSEQGSTVSVLPPLVTILNEQFLDPIRRHCCDLLTKPSEIVVSSRHSIVATPARHDILFTFWDDHEQFYPTSFTTDDDLTPFLISEFLRSQQLP
ncbi:hypothetical protein DM01DRAFT_1410667 [Hesseltinella vesiculosa]|uniref:Spindle pole body component n=1 Tax=Hesseltinella vesiculosa TaxID=101127 RepID=A0A1X2G6G0_9FUNG|nr:hypothetical protein DM01DRAFT_1410667 [Hesseltinella vesiculosa]